MCIVCVACACEQAGTMEVKGAPETPPALGCGSLLGMEVRSSPRAAVLLTTPHCAPSMFVFNTEKLALVSGYCFCCSHNECHHSALLSSSLEADIF